MAIPEQKHVLTYFFLVKLLLVSLHFKPAFTTKLYVSTNDDCKHVILCLLCLLNLLSLMATSLLLVLSEVTKGCAGFLHYPSLHS